MKPKKLPFDEYVYIYSKVPRLAVDLVIKTKKGVLLAKRNIPPDLGWWHLPGGTVLMGETLKDTADRVALEELNIKVKIKKMLGILEYTEGSGLGYPKSVIFLVQPLSGHIVVGEQLSEIDYFSTFPEKTLPEVKKYLQKQFDL